MIGALTGLDEEDLRFYFEYDLKDALEEGEIDVAKWKSNEEVLSDEDDDVD